MEKENNKRYGNLEWTKFVPSYLALINDFFSYSKSNEKVMTLFVEGKADKEFFEKIFPLKINDSEREIKSPHIFMGNFYRSKWLDENTIMLFGNPYLKEELKRQKVRYRDIKEKVNEIHQEKVHNCKFVEEVGRVFGVVGKNSNIQQQNFSNINGFSFVDRDFNDESYVDRWKYDSNNISYSVAHDYETTIFYLFFPYLCEEKNIKVDIRKLGRVLWLTTNQGFLEKFSIMHPELELKKLSNFNFYDEDKWGRINDEYNDAENLFDFEKYIRNECQIEIDALEKELNMFIKNISSGFYKNIKDWIENKNQTEVMNKIFCFSNGHLLWKHFILNFGDLFSVDNDEELTTMFVEYIMKKKKEILIQKSPLKEYLEFYNNIYR